jgi:type I restriction enzyme S subunit
VTTLGDYCDVTMGQAPTGDTYNTEENGLPLLAGASDLGDVTPAPSRWTSAPTQVCEKGDIILCIRATIGDRNWADRRYCLGRGVAGLRAKPNKLEPRYLWHWIAASTPTLMHAARGATFLQVNRRDIENLPCSPPRSLAEQRRIADILDKADAIRRKRKEAIALTEQLLRSAFLEMFGDPVTNPKGWPVKPLSEVVREGTIVTYGIVQAGPEVQGGIPYIRTGDIKDSRILTDRLLRTSVEIAARFQRSEVRAGDLVMSIRATVGTIAVVPPELDGANLTQGTARISPGREVTREYLFEHIRAPGMQRWLQERVKGATFKEITLAALRTAPIMVPPRAQQERFTSVARALQSSMRNQQLALEESVVLFNSLVARAFSGALSS